MPLIGWDAFCEGHHRPFVIHAPRAAQAPQACFGALQQFVCSIGLIGNFSFFQAETFARIVFELEADAVRVARALGARAAGQADEWAGQWLLSPDWATAERMTTGASSSRRLPSRPNQTKRRLRRRWHQLPVSQRIFSTEPATGREARELHGALP